MGKQRRQFIFIAKTTLAIGVALVQSGRAEIVPSPHKSDTIPVKIRRISIRYTPARANDQIYVIEDTNYSDGSTVRRPTAIWAKTKVPLEILYLEDFRLPSRLVPGSEIYHLSLSNNVFIRPTTKIVRTSQLTDQEFVSTLDSFCYEDEQTAVATLHSESEMHRTIHNSATAQSTNGRSPYFILGYVVCVSSDTKSE